MFFFFIPIVSVMDAFEIKAGTPGSSHAPGLVLVFDGRQCGFRVPAPGSPVELLRPDGTTRRAEVGELKEHGDGRSLFFGGLAKSDAPVGTLIYWAPQEPLTVEARAAVGGTNG